MAEADIKDIPVYRAMAEIKRRGGLNLKKDKLPTFGRR